MIDVPIYWLLFVSETSNISSPVYSVHKLIHVEVTTVSEYHREGMKYQALWAEARQLYPWSTVDSMLLERAWSENPLLHAIDEWQKEHGA